MHLIHVIPIARGIQLEVLSYFSSDSPPLGSVVKIPLRKRTIPALVAGVERADASKATLKRSSFSLRKIDAENASRLLTSSVLEAAKKTSLYYTSSRGAVLASVVPKPAIENASSLILNETEKGDGYKTDLIFNTSEYTSIAQRASLKNGSVYIAVSSIASGEELCNLLSKYNPVLLHGSISQKEVKKRLSSALEPGKVIIGTPSFITLPYKKLAHILIHDESARGYVIPFRPYIDARIFIQNLAEELGVNLTISGFPPRIETLALFEKFPDIPKGETKIIDMRERKEKPFKTLSNEAFDLISKSKHVFVFASRKGLSPITVCNDCATPVSCPRCGIPIVLHEINGKRIFICHACGKEISSDAKCVVCGGWNFNQLGVSIDRVRQDIEKYTLGKRIFVLDSDGVKTHAEARKLIEEFKEKGGVLLGTEMALPYLPALEASVIASADSLLLRPEWRAEERFISFLFRVREKTEKTFLIQTRLPENSSVRAVSKGQFKDFFEEEVARRKQLRYPPYATLILFSISGTKSRVLREIEKISTDLHSWNPLTYPAWQEKKGGSYTMHALLKLAPEKWPDQNLQKKIRALPLHIRVQMNPESIL